MTAVFYMITFLIVLYGLQVTEACLTGEARSAQ